MNGLKDVIDIPYEILFNSELNGTDLKIWGIIYNSPDHQFSGTNRNLSEIIKGSCNRTINSLLKLKRLGLIETGIRDGKRYIKAIING